MLLVCIFMTAVGFLSGSVLYSYCIPHWFLHIDVRKGSSDGNPGSTNAMHAVGIPIGILCMVLDILKAFVPVFAAVQFLDIRGYFLIPVTVAPSFGHVFSPFLGGKGGKAVTTTYGGLLGLLPVSRVVLILALVMVVFRFLIVIRTDSFMVTVSLIIIMLFSLLFEPQLWVKIIGAVISLLVGCKTITHPNPGDHRICIGHYTLYYKDKHFRLHKV